LALPVWVACPVKSHSTTTNSATTAATTTRNDTRWLDAWYGKRRWTLWLLPLMWLFRLLAECRRYWLTHFAQETFTVPVIVVGNISVGGTGKTPLLIALIEQLQAQGFKPGVISRGYGGKAPQYPLLLTHNSSAAETGDEPLGIFQRTGCAVCVGPDRVASGHELIKHGCDILLSDDGLQHYRLARDVEIAVVDGKRGFGNGFCLPVGPLREPVKRLASVDFVVVNGASEISLPPTAVETFSMTIVSAHWVRLVDGLTLPLNHFSPGTRVHAVAGIGNPQRFYQSLRELNVAVCEHDFPDHHAYDARDLTFAESLPVVMTAKDAVKCASFAQDNWYYLVVDAHLPELFWQTFNDRIIQLRNR
jgi:tetraacyldisaccharide 4'-kinase